VPLSSSLLEDRGVVFVSGADAPGFLQGLLTNDVEGLEPLAARHAALLTPQGKILFEIMVIRTEDGFLLDVQRALAPDLVKRLTFYRLRAKVDLADVSDSHGVAALWGGTADLPDDILVDDPRLPGLGQRAVMAREGAGERLAAAGAALVPADAYHAHRIALAVPEAGKDYAIGDTFPHEADMDLLGGIDFRKGCYVGQEVVSRMQHKTAVRKRVVPVRLGELRPMEGVDVMMGEIGIGYMGSSVAGRGLAMLRLDRVADAAEKGVPLIAGGIEVAAVKPAWAKFDMPGAA